MNAKCFSLFSLLLITIASCTHEKSTIQINSLISDHMVIQQNEDFAIWGTYSGTDPISITTSWGETAKTNADGDHHWKVILPSPPSGGPYQIDINTRDTSISIEDVLSGEVWLASGQSNMEMPLTGWPPNDTIMNSTAEIAQANYPQIRMYTLAHSASKTLSDDPHSEWKVCSPSTSGDFSATAYFFAQKLNKELGIPIGVIHSSWGGTPAEAWTSAKGLKSIGDFDESINQLEIYDPNIEKQWFDKWDKHLIPQNEKGWQDFHLNDVHASEAQIQTEHWISLTVPSLWENTKVATLKTFDGVVWMRREFEVANNDNDYTLHLPAIDDMDMTYINGELVGETLGSGKYNIPRTYAIKKGLLKKGTNSIAIKVIDTGGGGGIFGNTDFSLSSSSGDKIALGGEWKCLPVAEIYDGHIYDYGIAKDGFAARPDNILQLNGHSPSALYNGMIHPLQNYNIQGAIWYQGESNVGRDQQYKKLFPAMITDWREKWNKEFPFYFVQIAPYNYTNNADPSDDQSQKLRYAQMNTLQLKNTGMAVTMDIGNFNNIHPANKSDVGYRLADIALARDYKKATVYTGPLFTGATIRNGEVTLSFDHIGSGLKARGGNLTGFEIAGSNKIYKPANAKIVNNQVVLSAQGITPQYFRYAWSDTPTASLFNNEGLPASSFTSENN